MAMLVGDMGLSALQHPLLNVRCCDVTSVPPALLSPPCPTHRTYSRKLRSHSAWLKKS